MTALKAIDNRTKLEANTVILVFTPKDCADFCTASIDFDSAESGSARAASMRSL